MKNTSASTNPLKRLYNAIKQDYSIQRYSLGWSDVITALDKRYKKPIPVTKESFENFLLLEAISKGSLKETLEAFARELNISLQTLREKDTNPQHR